MKLEVWMHRKTGQLYEAVHSPVWGLILFWEDTLRSNKPWSDDTPGMFADDERYIERDYVNLGDL